MFVLIKIQNKKTEPKTIIFTSNWSIMICLIAYCLILSICYNTKYLHSSISIDSTAHSCNKWHVSDWNWFLLIHTVSSRNVAHADFVQWQLFSVEFHVEMRSKLSINFVGLSAYKNRLSSSENPTKFIRNDNKSTDRATEFCRHFI